MVLLEPLNRYEDYLVHTLADGASIVCEVGSPGVALTADTYHMSVEETRIGEAIKANAELIGHVQLGDSNRLEPGNGHYDWADTLDALIDIDYDGWLAMECGLSGTADEVLPDVARLLRRAGAQSGVAVPNACRTDSEERTTTLRPLIVAPQAQRENQPA